MPFEGTPDRSQEQGSDHFDQVVEQFFQEFSTKPYEDMTPKQQKLADQIREYIEEKRERKPPTLH